MSKKIDVFCICIIGLDLLSENDDVNIARIKSLIDNYQNGKLKEDEFLAFYALELGSILFRASNKKYNAFKRFLSTRYELIFDLSNIVSTLFTLTMRSFKKQSPNFSFENKKDLKKIAQVLNGMVAGYISPGINKITLIHDLALIASKYLEEPETKEHQFFIEHLDKSVQDVLNS